MTNLRRALLVTVFGALGASTAIAQTNAPMAPMPFCPEGSVIIVDGARECQIADSLDKLIKEMEEAEIKGDPISAGSEGDREALRKLPDVSPENIAAGTAKLRSFKARHAALVPLSRDRAEQLNYDLLGFVIDQRLLLADYDESRIPFTNDSGFFNELAYISRQTTFDTVDDYEAYAARLTELPRYFRQHRANMSRGIKTGMTASAEIMPGILDMVEALSKGPMNEHPFFQPFTDINASIDADEQKRLKALGEAAMNMAVFPAYRDLAKYLKKDYIPKARASVGVGTTPEGRAYYEALTKYFTTLDITPDEVHQIGLNEVARIRGEMDKIIVETEFKGTFKEFLDFLRTDPQFYTDDPKQLLKEASYIAKKVDGKMPEFFRTLPRLSYGVIKVPDEIAPNYTTGRYWGGNPKQGRAGNYVVNTHNLKMRPLYNLPALTLHEGVPGHHHQISLGQELKDVPKFRQNLYPNAFGEGWGLYSEKLGEEMGIYTTPYEKFGRLTYEMWRACRLVVDTGMHYKGWTREQAEACFFENSALAAHNIKTEVERYISWPGQALAYKIGELKIVELRERAEAALGERFSIRDFHDAVLLDGGVPLTILEAKIDRWIAEQLAAPVNSTSVAP